MGGGTSCKFTVPLTMTDESFLEEAPTPWVRARRGQLTLFDYPRTGRVNASYRHCLWTAPALDRPTLAWRVFFVDKRMYIRTTEPPARDAPS